MKLPIPALALRTGLNFAKQPVNEHNGFNPGGTRNVQGMNVKNMNYEIFRSVGFPAIAQTHLTFGVGYDITRTLVVNLSYMHSFEETFSQSSTGDLAKMESTMSQDSLSFGLTWRF